VGGENMRVTLYKFFKAFYGEFSTGNVHFARAIGDTDERIHLGYHLRSEIPIVHYYEDRYARQLAIGFLETFWRLANADTENPISNLEYIRNKFVIPKAILTNRKRLDVICNYCYDKRFKRIIFLEYGDLDVVKRWLPIFKAFASSRFPLIGIPDIQIVSCWDLLKGTTYEAEYSSFDQVKNENLMATAKELVLRNI
jgi:hypothetical protein